MSAHHVIVHPDAEALAASAAARLLTRIVDLQCEQPVVHLALTGGTIGIATLAAVAASPARLAIDWSAVHFWWGDERFLREGDPERNETQARAALLDHIPVDPAKVHSMVPPGSPGVVYADHAAIVYATLLDRYGVPVPGATGKVPPFDVLMLGVGPDGHIASLFPGSPALRSTETCVGIEDSPKPPPHRVTLTLPAIQSSREVWLVAAGEEKSEAVSRALAGAPVVETPATAARGRERTLWLLDVAAAAASGHPA